jgi:4-amino-4-deoxy-L-arabinose transferase-like glycosyltransferase
VPMFNNAPRYAKPPLIYWCQTVSYRVFGENAFAARLPSLVATAATALLLVTWGMRLGSAQVGLGAALLYAFCFQTVQQGRVATADALLIFFMTLTAFTGWKILQPKVPGRVPAICFVILALGIAGGFLAKGPEALLPLFPLLWYARGTRRNVILSLGAGLALVLLWALPAYIETDGDYWWKGLKEGVGDRAVSSMQGHGGSYLLFLPLYVILFWLSALPWSPLLIIHRRKLFVGWKRDLTDSYLLLNAALIFIVFTLMVTKLPHYTLPAFPFLALALARRWEFVGLPKGSLVKMGWITGAGFAVVTAIFVSIAMANHGTPSPIGELVRLAGPAITPETQISVVDFQEPNAVWETRRVSRRFVKFINPYAIAAALSQPGSQAIILPTVEWNKISSYAQGVTDKDKSTWKIYQARGVNAAKISFRPLPSPEPLDFTMIVKP